MIRSQKKENGYRYFSEDDIYRLMCIVYRRKMNDSLEEIRDFVKDDKSVANMREHLKREFRKRRRRFGATGRQLQGWS